MQTRVMQTAEAEWGSPTGHEERTVVGPEDALTLCAEIESQGAHHTFVGFTTPSGAFFGIGLGAPDSCAMYSESADPPYFHSHGPHADGLEETYWYDGHHTEMPGTARIERASAFLALREFMQSGLLPSVIAWDVT